MNFSRFMSSRKEPRARSRRRRAAGGGAHLRVTIDYVPLSLLAVSDGLFELILSQMTNLCRNDGRLRPYDIPDLSASTRFSIRATFPTRQVFILDLASI
ncbi:hypothetical protein EVAR_41132_1 [Eumeta japonica]|uniref:Uncharacterized protein n=1 Tax=Eumeta variegata TaxID=151549 RepID=A0A4C1YA54_EUMVA|nr:hypothetical protein EVAR_41132_1 [Eumeta japonica]